MVDDTWNFWDYVDFNTCLGRTDVDEGKVFKTYTEYKRAVADEAAKLVAGNDSTGADEAATLVAAAGNDSTGAVTGVAGNDSAGAVTGALFAKSSKASSKSKSGKASSKAVKPPFQ